MRKMRSSAALAVAEACGKVILAGEHAVVYGVPAIALPVWGKQAKAALYEGEVSNSSDLKITLPDLHEEFSLSEVKSGHRHAWILETLEVAAQYLKVPTEHSYGLGGKELSVTSTIPVAAGLGSGAAVATVLARVYANYFNLSPSPSEISNIVYEVEKLHHGTPSGVDNTVIAHGQPVYFVRDVCTKVLKVGAPFSLVIADTGVRSETKIAVGDVRKCYEKDPATYQGYFNEVRDIVDSIRDMIEKGQGNEIGPLMIDNQRLLEKIGVSSPELELFVEGALEAGASGAKLCGAGRGGNMAALVKDEETGERVMEKLRSLGGKGVFMTSIDPNHHEV
uniref:Mevalonate kinase n=1 Tax=Palpitomonas bilix TaxID=652834 RepID=A0A7S3DGX5_9EUKA